MAASPMLWAVHDDPRSSAVPMAPAGISSSAFAVSPTMLSTFPFGIPC